MEHTTKTFIFLPIKKDWYLIDYVIYNPTKTQYLFENSSMSTHRIRCQYILGQTCENNVHIIEADDEN